MSWWRVVAGAGGGVAEGWRRGSTVPLQPPPRRVLGAPAAYTHNKWYYVQYYTHTRPIVCYFCQAFNNILLLWSSGKGQVRIGKGWPFRRKASKLKPLPRAYIKVGCHPPPTTTTQKSQYTWLMAWSWPGEAGGGKGSCVGSLWVNISISKHKANTTELHPKVRQTCYH